MALTLLSSPARTSDKIGSVLDVRVVRVEAGRTVVALRGEADASTTAILSDALSRVIATRAGDVVVDFGQLEFVDTATVRVVATANHLLVSQGRTLTVRSPSRLTIRMLDLFGIAERIEPAELAIDVHQSGNRRVDPACRPHRFDDART
jgi:anti-anti-sigma factor